MFRRMAMHPPMQTTQSTLAKHVLDIKKALSDYDRLIGFIPASDADHDQIQQKVKESQRKLDAIVAAINAKNVLNAKVAIKTANESVLELANITENYSYEFSNADKKEQIISRSRNLKTALSIMVQLGDRLNAIFNVNEDRQKIVTEIKNSSISIDQFDSLIKWLVDQNTQEMLRKLANIIRNIHYQTLVYLNLEDEVSAFSSHQQTIVALKNLIDKINTLTFAEDSKKSLISFCTETKVILDKIHEDISKLIENVSHSEMIVSVQQKRKINNFLVQEFKKNNENVETFSKQIASSELSPETQENVGTLLTLISKYNNESAAYCDMNDFKNAKETNEKTIGVSREVLELTENFPLIEDLISAQESLDNGFARLLEIPSDDSIEPFIVDGVTTLGEYYPTPPDVVDSLLELADIQSNDVIFDLGCGDGRISIAAAKKYGITGVGVDFNPTRVETAKKNVVTEGVYDKISIVKGDAARAPNIETATVVTLYLLDYGMDILKPILQEKLPRGARIVSHDFKFKDWTPNETKTVVDSNGDNHVLSLYLVEK